MSPAPAISLDVKTDIVLRNNNGAWRSGTGTALQSAIPAFSPNEPSLRPGLTPNSAVGKLSI
jgi:hypothetical protein